MLKRRARPNSSVASTCQSNRVGKEDITEVNLILQVVGSLIPSRLQGLAVSTPLHNIRNQITNRYGSVKANEPDSSIRSHHSLIERGIIQLDDLQLLSCNDSARYPIHKQSSIRAKSQEKSYNGVRVIHFLSTTYLAFIIKQKSMTLSSGFGTNKQLQNTYYLHLNDQYNLNERQTVYP